MLLSKTLISKVDTVKHKFSLIKTRMMIEIIYEIKASLEGKYMSNLILPSTFILIVILFQGREFFVHFFFLVSNLVNWYGNSHNINLIS